MSNRDELQAFVKTAKEKGATDEFLVAMLRDKGWPAKDVYAVFAQRYAEQTGIVLPEPPSSWRPRARRSFICSRL